MDAPTIRRGWFLFFAALPLAGLLLYAGSTGLFKAAFFSIFGVGVLVAGGAATVGALLGFLFAIPRVVVAEGQTQGRLSSNSNLEKVSDWLTTILIGLGLVELGTLTSGIRELADDLAVGLGSSTETAEAAALALIVYMLIFGFIAAYIVTRIVLAVRLKEVEELLAQRREVLGSPLVPPPAKPTATREVEEVLALRDEVPDGPPVPPVPQESAAPEVQREPAEGAEKQLPKDGHEDGPEGGRVDDPADEEGSLEDRKEGQPKTGDEAETEKRHGQEPGTRRDRPSGAQRRGPGE